MVFLHFIRYFSAVILVYRLLLLSPRMTDLRLILISEQKLRLWRTGTPKRLSKESTSHGAPDVSYNIVANIQNKACTRCLDRTEPFRLGRVGRETKMVAGNGH